jgi:hypothetical protein
MTSTTHSFDSHVALLRLFLAQRATIIDSIERLLHSQKSPIDYQQDLALLSQRFKDCFFALSALNSVQRQLRDQLEHAHWASGFKPRANPGNDIIDPAALLLRGLHCWRQTRWPGQKGRVRYAHTLFNVYLLRCLTLLTMRLWDASADASANGRGDGNDDLTANAASARLAQAQAVLNALWLSSPADQPVLVRDVRWLIPVAISPTTDTLTGYFAVMENIARCLPVADQVAIQKACVQTGAGHLRSQLYHLAAQKGVAINEHSLVLVTRVSNALDIALLLQGLVTLLKAYEQAIRDCDDQQRLPLAAAIAQGLSPDPELFVNRLDLLGPYTMIEHLFVACDSEGSATYTAMGQRHRQLLRDYQTLITSLAKPLLDDCHHSVPRAGAYSPYGALYGFSSNLLELMAFKTLQLDAESRFSMEDIFTAGAADKRVWVNGWRNLPHIKPDVIKQFEYPEQFASDIHTRVAQALQRRMTADATNAAIPAGYLFIVPADDSQATEQLAHIPALAARYVVSSDAQLVAANKAEAKAQDDLLYCRLEGEFVLSYQTAGGWVGISKDFLTDVMGAGQDVKIVGLPRDAAAVLRLLCAELTASAGGMNEER